jgi:hypothetical protein
MHVQDSQFGHDFVVEHQRTFCQRLAYSGVWAGEFDMLPIVGDPLDMRRCSGWRRPDVARQLFNKLQPGRARRTKKLYEEDPKKLVQEAWGLWLSHQRDLFDKKEHWIQQTMGVEQRGLPYDSYMELNDAHFRS